MTIVTPIYQRNAKAYAKAARGAIQKHVIVISQQLLTIKPEAALVLRPRRSFKRTRRVFGRPWTEGSQWDPLERLSRWGLSGGQEANPQTRIGGATGQECKHRWPPNNPTTIGPGIAGGRIH